MCACAHTSEWCLRAYWARGDASAFFSFHIRSGSQRLVVPKSTVCVVFCFFATTKKVWTSPGRSFDFSFLEGRGGGEVGGKYRFGSLPFTTAWSGSPIHSLCSQKTAERACCSLKTPAHTRTPSSIHHRKWGSAEELWTLPNCRRKSPQIQTMHQFLYQRGFEGPRRFDDWSCHVLQFVAGHRYVF